MQPTDAETRERRILDLVRDHGPVDIGALAQQFGVTPQTVRRSVNRLSERGLLRRVHGGVTLPAAGTNLPWETRQVQHLQGKRRIAAAVAAHIEDGASVAIGLGTTPHQVALALRARRGLRVVTNSLRVVFALAGAEGLEIAVAGGFLRPADLDVVGDAAVRCFAGFKTDYAVFGVGGIDEDGALLDFDPAEVAAREAMRQNCRQSLLVVDASKFGRAALARGARLADIDHLFVDALPAPAFRPLLARGADGGRPQLHLAQEAAP
jgi:DeoR family transcriptional regulator, glycerol-3-phosphate regulon repressor